jgi:hypothetical protein
MIKQPPKNQECDFSILLPMSRVARIEFMISRVYNRIEICAKFKDLIIITLLMDINIRNFAL